MLLRVDRADDPALEPYTRVRERDLVGRRGLFIAEGEVVLRVLAERSPARVRSLLLEERRVDAVRDVVEGLPDAVPVYVVAQEIMDQVVGFSIHRGVLALGARSEEASPRRLLEQASLVVGLVGLTNHDNVGGIFRNAAAFGADAVLLDPATCDPLYRKAIRVSAGAALFVPFARCASVDAMLDALGEAGLEPIALTPKGEESIEALPPGRRALLLGTEGPGLPPEVLARTRRVRIAMAPGFDSLNVAVASGVALHEAVRARGRG
jgi:tRNA G18 (ribose-2'-O)-methylase SpoU